VTGVQTCALPIYRSNRANVEWPNDIAFNFQQLAIESPSAANLSES